MQHSKHPATATDITGILGPLEVSLVVEILEIGATAEEVLEASTWIDADDQIGTELDRGPRGAVTRVYEILKREESEASERR